MEPTVGEIRLFAGNFAPQGWAFCDGQLLPITQNTALFSIIGCTYGGNCTTSFALPDLQGRVPVGPRQGPGLQDWRVGEVQGTETNTLTVEQMPAHRHTIACNDSSADGTSNNPENAFIGTGPLNRSTGLPINTRFATTSDGTAMNTQSLSLTGNQEPVNNIQPSLGLHYIIALVGVYPSRG